jgi:hypothetical protein
MTDENLSDPLVEQEKRLAEVHVRHIARLEESGILQKAQRAYVAEYMPIPSGGGRGGVDISDSLHANQFAVGHAQNNSVENILIFQGQSHPILVGTITNTDGSQPKIEANQKKGFNVVDVRSVASMVSQLVGLKQSGELPDLSDDLQQIAQTKDNAEKPEVISPLQQTEPVEPGGTVIDTDEAIHLLSYSDVLPEQYQADGLNAVKKGATTMNYAEELVNLYKQHGKQAVEKLARDMVGFCALILQKKNITPSIYAPSISWALWDIAKQSYFAKHPEESSLEYKDSLEDPFALSAKGDEKRAEIRERHVGWEIMRRADQGEVRLADLPADAQQILTSAERNETGQLRSYDLAKLGRVVAQSV